MCRVNHCFKAKPPKHNSPRFNILCHGKNKISPGPHHKKEVQHSRPVLPLYSEARPLPPFQPIPLLRASSSLKAPYPQANDHPHHRPLGASLSCTTARSKCQQAEQQPLDHCYGLHHRSLPDIPGTGGQPVLSHRLYWPNQKDISQSVGTETFS